MAIDDPLISALTRLLDTADPEALAWLAMMCYAAGWSDAADELPLPIADARVAELIQTAAFGWQARIARQQARRPLRSEPYT